jgi:DNA-binding NarL/FixJ family response regulator
VQESTIRVIVVDDFEPWRRFVCSTLQKRPGLQVISEVSDGLEAVQKAKELQPDLIVLDIGLPVLNGIEAARQIREQAPKSRILFVSENRSPNFAREASRTGGGYVVKSDAVSDLLPAVEAVLQGRQFVSAGLAGQDLTNPPDDHTANPRHRENFFAPAPLNVEVVHRHEVEFYPDDAAFVDAFARSIEAALNRGSAVVVIATESHHASILQRLGSDGVDIGAAGERNLYLPLDIADPLSTFTVDETVKAAKQNRLGVAVD